MLYDQQPRARPAGAGDAGGAGARCGARRRRPAARDVVDAEVVDEDDKK